MAVVPLHIDPLKGMSAVWSEDGDEMFVSKHVTRGQARAMFCAETGVAFIDAHTSTVFMKRQTKDDPQWTDFEGDNPWPHGGEYDEWYEIVPYAEAEFECWMVF